MMLEIPTVVVVVLDRPSPVVVRVISNESYDITGCVGGVLTFKLT